ncbi:choice-of-anchor J domain-containing protein [Micromonospora krabiensis]|uniref:Immune inhibitor A peptidase M6 n=1 Tax=Micromonospora krabiensis TaxID=307121 RepID=A0A1C3MXR9_9ACTN|nr:choice-of-anchor J domain-containing protein [Micromonospora krabiensis]SBV25118.1 Immune inhibitor A peptidase M6 [Micromonospora krabiensis]
MARSRIAAAASISLVLPFLTVLPASGAAAAPAQPTARNDRPGDDTRELTRKNFTLDGRKVETPARYQPRTQARSRTQAAAQTPAVGTVRQWLGLDDTTGAYYRKDYTLRGVGENIEVWVATDLAFPANDCRNQVATTTQITDAQVQNFVHEFDATMYPKETAAFSRPPDRDGSNAQVGPDANGNGGVYTGAGNKTVTLVDNVRDDNYYQFPAAPTYIAGFFSAQLNELFDRNVMTIDAFDWLHRTGANPPDEPTDDLCTSRPARPHSYEGTFAHEWQHLAQYYTDPFEGAWLNEGLSDFAQTLTGYVDTRATVYDRGADGHLYCYQGFGTVKTPYNANPRDCGGPENSLNLWDESPNPNAVLADYGNAYSFIQFLYDRYGQDIVHRLHNDGDLQGLASVKKALKAEGATDMYEVIHDYQTMTLVDKIVGDAKLGIMLGVSKSRVTSKSLRSTVNLENPAAYATPGAAPNGADYVPLQKANGTLLRGSDLRSLSFQGNKTLPALPLAWTVVNNDPDRAGNPVLFSGNGNNTDAAAVTKVTVPTADPTLRFVAKYGAEFGFDYGYVTVSTDGGATYTIVPGDKTVDGPLGPGVNGTTNGFEAHSYDLSAYAGKSVLLGFRYVSDGGVNEGGWLVDDITVGGTVVSDGSSLTPFDSPTEIKPTAVANWNLRLIGLDEKHSRAWQFEFDGKSALTLNRVQLALLSIFPKVVAVVAYDEPTEQVTQYAPYTLKVNGVVQPGGAA